jgi:hypothetical protein
MRCAGGHPGVKTLSSGPLPPDRAWRRTMQPLRRARHLKAYRSSFTIQRLRDPRARAAEMILDSRDRDAKFLGYLLVGHVLARCMIKTCRVLWGRAHGLSVETLGVGCLDRKALIRLHCNFEMF